MPLSPGWPVPVRLGPIYPHGPYRDHLGCGGEIDTDISDRYIVNGLQTGHLKDTHPPQPCAARTSLCRQIRQQVL